MRTMADGGCASTQPLGSAVAKDPLHRRWPTRASNCPSGPYSLHLQKHGTHERAGLWSYLPQNHTMGTALTKVRAVATEGLQLKVGGYL